MKKILSIVLFFMICFTINAQDEATEETKTKGENVKIAFNLGTTSGDATARDNYSSNLGFDFTYLFDVTKDIQVGATAGAVYVFKNDCSDSALPTNDSAFITFGGTFRFYTDNDKFHLGADAGYGYGLEEGGFYYRPRIGMMICERAGINVSYSELNDANGKYSYANIGYEFSF